MWLSDQIWGSPQKKHHELRAFPMAYQSVSGFETWYPIKTDLFILTIFACYKVGPLNHRLVKGEASVTSAFFFNASNLIPTHTPFDLIPEKNPSHKKHPSPNTIHIIHRSHPFFF